MVAEPDCAPLPAQPLIRSAALSRSPCRRSSRRCRPPAKPQETVVPKSENGLQAIDIQPSSNPNYGSWAIPIIKKIMFWGSLMRLIAISVALVAYAATNAQAQSYNSRCWWAASGILACNSELETPRTITRTLCGFGADAVCTTKVEEKPLPRGPGTREDVRVDGYHNETVVIPGAAAATIADNASCPLPHRRMPGGGCSGMAR